MASYYSTVVDNVTLDPHSFAGSLDAPSEERRPSKAKKNRLSLKSTIRSLATNGKDTTYDK